MAQYGAQQNSPWLAFDTESGNIFDPGQIAPNGGGVFAKPPVTQQAINKTAALPQFTPQTGGIPEHVNSSGLPFGFTPYTDKPEYQALMKQMAANRDMSTAQQQMGISQYEDLLKAQLERNQNQQIDLSPLASLVDTWTGSNLAAGYRRPTDARTNLQTTEALQQGLQKAKGALTDDQVASLGQRAGMLQKGDETMAGLLTAQAKMKEQGLASGDLRERRMDDKALSARKDYNEKFGTNLDHLGQFAASITDVKDIMKSNGGEVPLDGPARAEYNSAVAMMLTRYNTDVAKLGALSGGDLNLLQKAIANGPDAVSSWFTQRFTGGAGGIMKVLNSLETGVDRSVANTKDRVKSIYGGLADDAYKISADQYGVAKKLGTRGVNPSSAEPHPVDLMTPEEVIAEYNKRQSAQANPSQGGR